jgi:hypothetical protein
MKLTIERMRRAELMEPTAKTTTSEQSSPNERPRKIETPQEFYRRFTQKPGVRELLSRLAKK